MEYKMKILLFTILALTFSSASHSADYKRCYNEPNTMAIEWCFHVEYKKLNQVLNEKYQTLLKRIDKATKAKEALSEAQQLFIKFREKDCDAVYKYSIDGTSRGRLYQTCLIERTEHRISEVENWIKK